MARQQLPPQIRKVTVKDRRTGKSVVRYQLTVDAGFDPDSGKRRQIRRRFATEAAACSELAAVQGGVNAGTYVHASKLTVDQACEAWLASKHSLKPTTLAGHRVSLGPLRNELRHVEVQKLTKADLDTLVGRLRRGDVDGHKSWSARSCNYILYLCTAVLDDQVAQGNVVRNIARLVDRVAGDPQRFRALTDAEMFAILDHDCRDRHLWALALYGLRRGEIAGLRWANVDLKAKTVSILENRVPIGKQIIVGTPKSKASNRTLPLPDEVVAVLKEARKRQAAERLAFGEGYGSGEYVASDETGRPYRPQLLTLRWGGIAVIAAWLGHVSAAFTMSVYAHSQDEALRAAASSFGRVVTICDTETGSQS